MCVGLSIYECASIKFLIQCPLDLVLRCNYLFTSLKSLQHISLCARRKVNFTRHLRGKKRKKRTFNNM